MRRAAWAAALLVLVAALAFVLHRRDHSAGGPRASVPPPPARSLPASPAPPLDPARSTVAETTAGGLVLWPTAVIASRTLNQPDASARDDIAVIQAVLSDYHGVFGEVPAGGLNEEITRGLAGDNPKKIVFLRADKTTLDASGALLDRWGTPWFFHKLSHDRIDLRSAGPDRRLWTSDDIFEESPGGRPPL